MAQQPKINNQELENQINAFKEDNSRENMAQMMALLEQATVIQPAIFPPGIDPGTLQRIQQGKAKLTPETSPKPMMIKNNQNGLNYFAVFTSEAQITGGAGFPAKVILPFAEVARMSERTKPNVEGVVINPFTDNVIVHMAGLEAMNRRTAAMKTPMAQMKAKDLPQFMLAQIGGSIIPARFFKEKQAFMDKLSAEKEEFVLSIFKEEYAHIKATPGKVDGLSDEAMEELAKKASVCPYSASDFEVMALNISDDCQIARIGLPADKPGKDALLSIFICLNPETEQKMVYAIRKGEKGQANLLSANDGTGYKQLGDAPEEGEELFVLMGQLPWKQ